MAAPILYSTNTYLKLLIQERFRKDSHYVWCSDCFDSSKTAAYGSAALAAPSSDPYKIYHQLKADCSRSDKHSTKISEQKLSLVKLASDWKAAGEITDAEAAEIVYLTEAADYSHWRPLLYVISYERVLSRVQVVPIQNRASLGMEYIIPDLKRHEFDIVEI